MDFGQVWINIRHLRLTNTLIFIMVDDIRYTINIMEILFKFSRLKVVLSYNNYFKHNPTKEPNHTWRKNDVDDMNDNSDG